MKKLVFVGLAATALFAFGCDDDTMGDTDAGPGGDVDSGPGGGMDSGPGGDTDAGPGGDTDAGDMVDTGVPINVDAGGGDVDGGSGGGGITCGMMTCDPATQVCCAGSGIGGARETCTPIGMCMGVSRGCDGPEDCGSGEVCCAERNGGGGLGVSTSCTAAANCMGGGFTQFEICHDMTDCNTSGHMCCPATILPGFDGYCRMMCLGTGLP